MITARCPSCSYEYQIPPTFVGKKIKCKQEGCGQIFKVAKEDIKPAEVIPESEFDEPQPAAETYQVESGYLDNSPQGFGEELEKLAQSEQFEKAGKPKEAKHNRQSSNYVFRNSDDDRYQNLKKYLLWAKQLAYVQLVLIYIAAAMLLISAVLSAAIGLGSGLELLTGTLGSVLIAGVGYLLYVFTLAGIEFVFVIIDIESNTRYVRNQLEDANA